MARARGWLDDPAVWRVAGEHARRPDARLDELFDGLLGRDDLDALLTGAASGEAASGSSTPRARAAPRDEDAPPYRFPAVDGPVDLADDAPQLSARSAARYSIGQSLGSGGVGKVVVARDSEIGRVVALKTLKLGVDGESATARRFVREARVAAQLEHPNIVPVYDVGTFADGQPYYTMRVVQRQSLQDVLASPELRRQWPLVRLVGAFVQVSRALAYAHRRGILHRDIKPENILLGDFGEVYLADWGNAKTLGATESPLEPIDMTSMGPPLADSSPSGLSGTPGYIAPELIRGDHARVDHRSDIFSLGVVLYEMLTGEHPFDAATVLTVILATQTRTPKQPRSIAPACPLVLEDLCLAMLAKDPADRPGSADEVAAEVEAFLEGAKERSRRREEARKMCELAADPARREHALEVERARLVDEARKLLQGVKGHEPIEKKRPGWELEDRAAEIEREQARVMAEAIDLYTKALAYDPELVEARGGLADQYWTRALRAQEERHPAMRVYYEALVAEFDVGRYAALLGADATLSLTSDPPDAVVHAYRYVEKDRVLVAGGERRLGQAPLADVHLEPGSYLLVVRRDGFRDVRYPVLLERGGHVDARVHLYTDAEIGEGFVYVPGGPFVVGGDADAYDSLPRAEVSVPDFAIGRFPVTLREYCTFLDDLARHDALLAAKRAPHDASGAEGHVVQRGASGLWEPLPFLEGEARRMFPAEEGHLWRVPALLVDWFDAAAYCRYRSAREGFEVRLPSELEWEKAARGTDGRLYPWGDRFDPAFCLMRESRPFPQPEPIGTFPIDASPYDVRDMGGGMREWVGDVYGERSWEETSSEPEPPPGAERDGSTWRVFRSGNWAAESRRCRSASRTKFFALARYPSLSFRVAKPLVRALRG